ncbi:MAG: hypothetical protein AB1744_14880, partial [Candidatus Zixiibacteriota bacterium]
MADVGEKQYYGPDETGPPGAPEMETGSSIVSAVDVHRQFETVDGTLYVLKGISLDVRRSEMA